MKFPMQRMKAEFVGGLLAATLVLPPFVQGANAQESQPAKATQAAEPAVKPYNEIIAESQQKTAELGIRGSAFDDAPKPGTVAPDFTLTPLKFYPFKTEKTDITIDNAGVLYEPVTLSSFKGEKPVALIFGSYT